MKILNYGSMAGKMDEGDLACVENDACPTCGSCSGMAAVSFIAVCGENVHQHACWRLGYSAADFYRLWGNRRHGYGKGKLRCTVACAAPMTIKPWRQPSWRSC